MSSRVRFDSARNVFEAFADLKYAVGAASRRLDAPRSRTRAADLAAPKRRDRLHRLFVTEEGNRMVGDSMRPRAAGRKGRGRCLARRRHMGARARRGQSARCARGRQRRRPERADNLARVRRRPVRRQPQRSGPTAGAGAALGLRDGCEHSGHDGGMRRRPARRRAENQGLRGSGNTLRRGRRRQSAGAGGRVAELRHGRKPDEREPLKYTVLVSYL